MKPKIQEDCVSKLRAGSDAGRGGQAQAQDAKHRIPAWPRLTKTGWIEMPRLPWREARPRRQSPAMPMSSSWEGMAMKPPSKARRIRVRGGARVDEPIRWRIYR